MKNDVHLRRALWVPTLCAGALLAACSGSSSSSNPSGIDGGTFSLATVSVDSGQIWQINRPISFTFSQPVDFDTVNLNTISIQQLGGGPAVGDFYAHATDPNTVIFQPVCPRKGDFSDAGFKPGGVAYQVNVPSFDNGATTVQSVSGRSLTGGSTRTFTTPASAQLDQLFLDPVAGPPTPLLRPLSTTGCYLELGDDADNRQYFEADMTGAGSLPLNYRVPMNLYSDPSSHIAVVVEFNQAVSPTPENISTSRIQIQYQQDNGDWTKVQSSIELVANCSETGATIRLAPVGVLPQGSPLRVWVGPQFEDLVGDRNIVELNNFANMNSDFATDDGVNPTDIADEYLEEFLTLDFEDRESALDSPRATWGPDGLKASFAFTGDGGPGGNFDFRVPPGTDFVLDTISDQVFGGPDFVQTASQLVVNGRLNVRNFHIPETSTMRIQGPNPALILASGYVLIEGKLSVDGGKAAQVFTLNTPYQPEAGAAGQGGGGAGGTGSFLTSQVTPRGQNGYGAFNVANGGGEGGEGGWSATSSANNRRSAGGGGGVFGHDMPANVTGAPELFCPDQSMYGLDAESGFVGGPNSFSTIVTTRQPPYGGKVGPSPFTDFGGRADDFFGSMRKDFNTADERLVTGELLSTYAGAGGGGGGDATKAPNGYPPATLVNGNSDKGAGGGGGAGGLTIMALGNIKIGSVGSITAIGGHGSGGENTGGTNRIGGGSGGGSGGHIILQTAAKFDLSDVPIGSMALDARGGEGGAGEGNQGGADEKERSNVASDAKHSGFPNPTGVGTLGDDNPWVPTLDSVCISYNTSLTAAQQKYVVRAAGGDGGPGVIQIHVGNLDFASSGHDILYPTGTEASLAGVVRPYPHGYDGISKRWVDQLLPTFGRISKAQTSWIPLGGVTVAPGASVSDPLSFLFDGTDISGSSTDGFILAPGGVVPALSPILAPAAAVEAAGLPEITGIRTLRFDASALTDDIYKRNANLTRLFSLTIGSSEFTVASAEYIKDGSNEYLDVTVQSSDPELTVQTGLVELIPRYFRVVTEGVVDSLPASASIKIEFQATTVNPQGAPSTDDVSAWVTDISALDTAQGAPTQWRFLRYRVSFDISVNNDPLTAATPQPMLEFLRMPFKF